VGGLPGLCRLGQVTCNYFNNDDNFVAYEDAQYFKLPTEDHIISCGNRRMLSPGTDLIAVVAGRLWPASDARYSSISVVDMYPPGANIRTITDGVLRRYYQDQGVSALNYTVSDPKVAQSHVICRPPDW
jgi:hypothetical protein